MSSNEVVPLKFAALVMYDVGPVAGVILKANPSLPLPVKSGEALVGSEAGFNA